MKAVPSATQCAELMLGNEGRPGGIVARRAGYAAGMPPAKERALEQLVLVDGVSEGVHGIYNL